MAARASASKSGATSTTRCAARRSSVRTTATPSHDSKINLTQAICSKINLTQAICSRVGGPGTCDTAPAGHRRTVRPRRPLRERFPLTSPDDLASKHLSGSGYALGQEGARPSRSRRRSMKREVRQELNVMEKTASGRSVARGFVLALLLLGVSGGQALAHRSPSNCNANRLTLSLDQNPAGNIVSGQTVTYTVGVFNPGPGTGIGCDVTGTTVTFTCPGADGTPSGQTTVLGTGSSFPADNSGDTIFPSVSCKIMVNSGVTLATARAQAGQNTGNRTADLTKGVLHDSAIDDPFVLINDLSVNVRTCVATVDKQVSCDGGLRFAGGGLVRSDEDG